jgi:hypothetical protein
MKKGGQLNLRKFPFFVAGSMAGARTTLVQWTPPGILGIAGKFLSLQEQLADYIDAST